MGLHSNSYMYISRLIPQGPPFVSGEWAPVYNSWTFSTGAERSTRLQAPWMKIALSHACHMAKTTKIHKYVGRLKM